MMHRTPTLLVLLAALHPSVALARAAAPATQPELQAGSVLALSAANITLQPQPDAPAPQETVPASTPPRMSRPAEDRKAKAVLGLYSDYEFAADFTDTEGEFSIWRSGIDLTMLFPAFDDSQFAARLGYQRWNFDFIDAVAFDSTSGDPWDGVNKLDLTLTFSQEVSEHWSYVVGATVGAAYADGAEFSDSITVGGLAGATYKFSDKLSIGGGVLVRTAIEDEVTVLPLITIDWKICETLSFSTNPSAGRRFLGLTYQPTDEWSFTGGLAYEFIDFRLDDSNDEFPQGVGRFRRLPVGIEVSYAPSEQVRIGLYGGVVLAQEVTLDDRDGERLQREEADAAPFIGVGLQWQF